MAAKSIEMHPMNDHIKHSRVRTTILGYHQGQRQSTQPADEPENYPFILTNWVRDKADSRKEEIKLTYLPPDDKDHQDQVATRWRLVESALHNDPEGRFAAQRCLADVERLHQKQFVHGKFIEAVTHQYPELVPHLVEPDNVVTARFVCFPLFALYPPQTAGDNNMHPPRAMAQYFYKLEDTSDRDARQAIRELRKLRPRGKKETDSITITAAPFNTRALRGQSLCLEKHDDSYKTLGASIRYTNRKKKQYFFPLGECKTWKQLIKKIGDIGDDPSGRQSDAEIILNHKSEYSLVDKDHVIVDEARWTRLANDPDIHHLVILQLVLKAFAHYDDDSEDEIEESTLSPKDKKNMHDHVVAKWVLTHRQLNLKKLQEDYEATSDEEVKRTLSAKIISAIHQAEAALKSTRRQQIASRLIAGAEKYHALSLPDPAESVASAMTPSLEQSADSFAYGSESFPLLRSETESLGFREFMSWLCAINIAGQGSPSHDGYYPRSNCHVSSRKPYRPLPGSQQMSRSNDIDQNSHISSIMHETSSPFTLRPVGMRQEDHYYNHGRFSYSNSPSTSTDGIAAITVHDTGRPARSHSAPQGSQYSPKSPTSKQTLHQMPLREEGSSGWSNDESLVRENSHGLHSKRGHRHRARHHREQRRTHKHFGSSSIYTPIFEWPIDGACPKLEDILRDLSQRLNIPVGAHKDAKNTSRQEDMRERCFKLLESLEERQSERKSKAAQAKRSLVTTAGDLIDCYVPDHFREPLVEEYWSKIHQICEVDRRLQLPQGLPGSDNHQQPRAPWVTTFVQDTSWKFYQRIQGILKSVQTTLTGRTVPYSVPQPLILSFEQLFKFYQLATETNEQALLDTAAQEVFNSLEKAEHELPNIADESEDSIFNCIGYQHVDAHALLGLILENSLRICSVDVHSSGTHESVCFDIVNIYGEYVTRIHSLARDNADLKVYEQIKLVSEELSIIKSVLSIQWQIAAAFEHMTSDRPSILERRVKSRIFEHIAQSMDHFDELNDRVKDARIDATQSIAVKTDLNNKAILIFTTVATIFLPLTFVSGLLSMNTKDTVNIPDGQWLFWSIALPLTFVIMISALLFVYFGSLVPTAKRVRDKVTKS